MELIDIGVERDLHAAEGERRVVGEGHALDALTLVIGAVT